MELAQLGLSVFLVKLLFGGSPRPRKSDTTRGSGSHSGHSLRPHGFLSVHVVRDPAYLSPLLCDLLFCSIGDGIQGHLPTELPPQPHPIFGDGISLHYCRLGSNL